MAVSRAAGRELLHLFLLFLALLEEHPNFPLAPCASPCSQHSPPILCLLTQMHEDPWVARWHLSFQLNEIIVVVVLWWKHSSSWTQGLWPTGAKVMKLESKYFVSGSLGAMESEPTPLSRFFSETSGPVFLLWIKISTFDLFFSQRNKWINKNNRNVCIAKPRRWPESLWLSELLGNYPQ